MTLKPRLDKIASLIPNGARVADVGTDHGYLPVFLCKQKQASFVIATDLNQEPLESAKAHARAHAVSDQIAFRLADGLSAVSCDEVDTVVIAGMGGETIVHILQSAQWTQDSAIRLILQPQSKISMFMQFLSENGYNIQTQHLVYETGKIYTVYEVTAGAMPPTSGGAIYVHRSLRESKSPLLPPYLEQLIGKFEHISKGLTQSSNENALALEGAQHILTDLIKWRAECL